MLPAFLQRTISRTSQVAHNFVPFGSFALMLGSAVRIVDSLTQPQLLHLTVSQLLKGIQRVGQQESDAPFIIQRLLLDHRITTYKHELRSSIQSMVPLLFMGGKISDYQPMLIQRQTHNGKTLHVNRLVDKAVPKCALQQRMHC